MTKPLYLFVLPTLLLLASLVGAMPDHGSAEEPLEGYIYGKVVKITDGDTLTILTGEKEQVKIRLAEIDTPERGQPYGKKAQEALSELVWPKNVAVRVVDIDRYGRTVGRIYVGETDVSAEMVRRGAAWVYRSTQRTRACMNLRPRLRTAERGIWGLSESQQMPPWEWRKMRRK